eukprot:TRINITY_DN1883_c0_g1_i1.p2 TRINITY_DN1883_c0_g1~~TRINITY_DN1883_c0_g1_i1.p2  ORF type:complete len:113 (-),score=15.18 TRINITY_DN1883_c0_g1_i1:618-956(-)
MNDNDNSHTVSFPEDNNFHNNVNNNPQVPYESDGNNNFNFINNVMDKSLEGWVIDEGMKRIGNINRWFNVYNLKYYFTVNNSYVLNKLKLLIFPFKHKVFKHFALFFHYKYK